MKTFYTKIPANELSANVITQYQKDAKEFGYDAVSFYWINSDTPFLTVGVDEDCANGVSKKDTK